MGILDYSLFLGLSPYCISPFELLLSADESNQSTDSTGGSIVSERRLGKWA